MKRFIVFGLVLCGLVATVMAAAPGLTSGSTSKEDCCCGPVCADCCGEKCVCPCTSECTDCKPGDKCSCCGKVCDAADAAACAKACDADSKAACAKACSQGK